MTKIELFGDSLLLKKLESKVKTKFEMSGSVDSTTPLYEVKYAGPDSDATKIIAGITVILKPGSYDAILINDEQFTYALREQVAGRVK